MPSPMTDSSNASLDASGSRDLSQQVTSTKTQPSGSSDLEERVVTSSPFPADAGLQKPVCVFCGSLPGKLPIFAKASEAVGRAMAEAKIPLVYGGGRRGLMGTVSQSILKAGGYAHGIVPRALMTRASERTPAPGASSTPSEKSAASPIINGEVLRSTEGAGKDMLEDDVGGRLTMEVTAGMHERKLKMAQMSSGGFIVLPGGYGTFEEALEMITWNQLNIHKLPVIILNINNVYTPLRQLFETSVESGFIMKENLSLMRVVDLPGGAEANADESKVEEWGQAAIDALRNWSTEKGAGYGLQWQEKPSGGKNIVKKFSPSMINFCGTPPPLALFTTLRYTSSSSRSDDCLADFTEEDIPLLRRHITRLKEAHGHFRRRDGESWGTWPGDDYVWKFLREKLIEKDREVKGDWRVRLMLHKGATLEIRILPAPKDAGQFNLSIPPKGDWALRTLILDPHTTDLKAESNEEIDLRLYKTNHRGIYDSAAARGGPEHPEVLIHTKTHILETATSNVAIQSIEGKWITPRISEDTPFLDGVVRRELLERGDLVEGNVTVEDLEDCRRRGGRVIGFNGLRGVWEARWT